MGRSGPSALRLQEWVTSSLTLTTRAILALSEAAEAGPDVPAPPLDPDKVVGEALLLLRATADVGAGRRNPAWRRLHAAAAPLARPESLPVVVCRDPAQALEVAFCHVQLSALGDTDPTLDVLLELALAEPDVGPEPYGVGALHRAWRSGVHSGSPDLAGIETLLGRSSLGRPVDLLRGSTQDAYDLTHAVMHATDLGAWPANVQRTAAELSADLDALLGLALDAENLDLATELLWCRPMLGLPTSPAADLGLTVVAAVRDDHGFLPGPGFDAALHGTLGPAAAEAYLLRTSYHATLVLGILGAALLAADTNLGEPDANPARTGTTSRLLALLGTGAHSWLAHADAADEGLARMMLAVAIRRASDRADLAGVRHLMELAVAHDLADTRIVSQAVGLLRRTTALMRSHSSADRLTG